MPAKLDPEKVRLHIESAGLKVIGEYEKAIKPISLECSEGHRFSRTWHSIKGKNATSCPLCSGYNGANKGHTTKSASKFFSSCGYKLLSEYQGSHGMLEYECDRGHVGQMTWTNFQSGKRCPSCAGRVKNSSSLKAELKKDGYTLIGSYEAGKNFLFRCPQGHKHSMHLSSWRMGSRCGKCHFVSESEVKKSFRNAGYTLLSEFTRSKEKLKFQCPNGHKHSITWNSWRRGTRCGKCASVDSQAIEKAFSDEGYTILGKYKPSGKIDYMCPNGHIRSITWSSFGGLGNRCAQCAGQVITQKQAASRFLKAGLELRAAYKNESTAMEFWCEGGQHSGFMNWRQLRRHGRCLHCYVPKIGFDCDRPGTLYYVAFESGDRTLYKIGITNGTVKKRFKGEPVPYRVVMEKRFLFGTLAKAEEQIILSKYKKHRYVGENILASGNTELFSKDVLRMDKDDKKKISDSTAF